MEKPAERDEIEPSVKTRRVLEKLKSIKSWIKDLTKIFGSYGRSLVVYPKVIEENSS